MENVIFHAQSVIESIKAGVIAPGVANDLIAHEVSEQAVAEKLAGLIASNAATFVSFVAVLDFDKKHFSAGYKDMPEQFKRIRYTNVVINADYESAVKKTMTEGNPENFRKSSTYEVVDPEFGIEALRCHKDDASRKYLRCHTQSSKTVVYNTLTGESLSQEAIEGLKTLMTKAGRDLFEARKPTHKVSDGITHNVKINNYGLGGICIIRAKGQELVL